MLEYKNVEINSYYHKLDLNDVLNEKENAKSKSHLHSVNGLQSNINNISLNIHSYDI